MTERPLRLLGDPLLRTPSDPVTRFDEVLSRLVTDLLETVQVPGRAGLAANQIGSSLAVFAYNVDGQLGYLINPLVTGWTAPRKGWRRACPFPASAPAANGRPRSPCPVPTWNSGRSPSPGPVSWRAASSTRPTTCAASCTSTGWAGRSGARSCASSGRR